MSQFVINLLFVGASFALYFGIAIWARAGSTKEFYVAGGGVHPVVNGMATAADWMSAASFISMAGLFAPGALRAAACTAPGCAVERIHRAGCADITRAARDDVARSTAPSAGRDAQLGHTASQ